MSIIERTCLECDTKFNIVEEEQNWYKEHDFSLPKRCKSCRRFRKARIIGREDVDYAKRKKKK